MSWEFFNKNQKKWCDDLCDYYGVDEETALLLGTRSKGRKPSLPGSETCEPVTDMTYEDLWDLSPRETVEEILQFQRDTGAWSTFRQSVRHKDLTELHKNILFPFVRPSVHICEYGCGIAPFTKTLFNEIGAPNPNIKVSLTDVENCEHLNFAEWRLRKQIKEKGLNIDLEVCPVNSKSLLPKYSSKLDVAIVFEVFEHIFSPLDVMNNLVEQMNDNAVLVENFIGDGHLDGGAGASDLESAAEERDDYYKFLDDNFVLIAGPPEAQHPDATRIWRKK